MAKSRKQGKQRRGKDGRFLPSSVDSKGYLVIKAGPQRDMRVHTLVAEAMLRRKLKKDEDVHHKDGNKLNCDWQNLRVMGHREHGAISTKQHYYVKTLGIKLKEEWDEYFDGEEAKAVAEGGDVGFP